MCPEEGVDVGPSSAMPAGRSLLAAVCPLAGQPADLRSLAGRQTPTTRPSARSALSMQARSRWCRCKGMRACRHRSARCAGAPPTRPKQALTAALQALSVRRSGVRRDLSRVAPAAAALRDRQLDDLARRRTWHWALHPDRATPAAPLPTSWPRARDLDQPCGLPRQESAPEPPGDLAASLRAPGRSSAPDLACARSSGCQLGLRLAPPGGIVDARVDGTDRMNILQQHVE